MATLQPIATYEAWGRTIPVYDVKPGLRPSEKLLDETKSLCPKCYALLPAYVFERNGQVFIRRECPEHGEWEEVYWSDAEMYRRAVKWAAEGRGPGVFQTELTAPCPFSCGLCPQHRSHTALVNLTVTNRCNLSCWYCFFYAEAAGYVHEPTIDEIRFMVRRFKGQGVTLAVQITGGEPMLRPDIVDIVNVLKEEGVRHVQLNTNGIRFAAPDGAELARKLREAGVNTVYLSFDGVTPHHNPKNHWEIPYIFDAFRKGGMTSVVLVPTVVRNANLDAVGDIVRFAAMNMDIVRGVNYQPVSITGMASRAERAKLRVTIPDVIKAIEEQTNGEIKRESWYPVPITVILSRFIEAYTGSKRFEMTNHPACGMATYVYVERENGEFKRFVSITDFIDVEGFFEYLSEKTEELKRAARFPGGKQLVVLKVLNALRKFIDDKKKPKELKVWRILYNVFVKHDYKALSVWHYTMLYLGMMHFMDLYNYDVKRVERCNVHYASPDGRIIPFCAYNVLNDLYRDYVLKRHMVTIDEWIRNRGKETIGNAIKYRRDAVRLASGELYKKTYAPFMKSGTW